MGGFLIEKSLTIILYEMTASFKRLWLPPQCQFSGCIFSPDPARWLCLEDEVGHCQGNSRKPGSSQAVVTDKLE